MPRFLSLLVLLGATAAFCAQAAAGDLADRRIIGFSPDGRYFAFEQYGVQDGSGFPYAELFVIDGAEDRWVPGTPVHVLMKDERNTVAQARAAAQKQAQALIDKLDIIEAGDLLASNPAAELSADPHSVTVNPGFRIVPPAEEPVTFTLEERSQASAACARYQAEPARGFRLTMRRRGAKPQVWHDDRDVPASRGCPLKYAIADVIRHRSAGGRESYAVLISVYQHGFEGPDRRFIAVTRLLP